MITGGNSGIGLESAQQFVARGEKVIILCRSRQRGEEALEEIRKRNRKVLGRGGARAELVLCDLCSFESIRNCVDELARLLEEGEEEEGEEEGGERQKTSSSSFLHALVLNAGIMLPSKSFVNMLGDDPSEIAFPSVEKARAVEMTLACNHLGHFYLTNLLLRHATLVPRRVVVLSSALHKSLGSLFL